MAVTRSLEKSGSSRWFRSGASRQSTIEARWGYVLIAPMVLGFSVFSLFALISSLALSLTSWDVLSSPVWVGIDNYIRLFSDDLFLSALRNTALIAIPNVIFRMIFSLALASALNTDIRFRSFYRVLFFMPVITMPVAIGTVWRWLYDPAFGPVNSFLGRIGLPQPEWLSGPNTAIAAVVIVLLWSGVGYDMIIFLAGLQSIPREYYEAAQLDGAGSWRRFMDITLPLLTPTTFFLMVISIIASLQIFDLVFIMTRLGNTNRLPTIVYYVYDEGFRNFRMGYAITIAWALLLIVMVFTLLQFRLQRRWVHYA